MSSLKFRSLAPAAMILALSMLATALFAGLARRDARTAAQQRFESEAREVRDVISGALNAYAQMLRGAAGYIAATPEPTRAGWRAYAARLHLEANFAGLQGLGYAVIVKQADLPGLVAAQRQQGAPSFDVFPPGDGPLYGVVIFHEPETGRNTRALGFDMLSEPVRRTAMERARDTGLPSLTGRVKLLQETDAKRQIGAVLYVPVYGPASVAPPPEQRTAELTGFVFAGFRMDDLMASLLDTRLPGRGQHLRIEIFDGGAAVPQALYYDSRPQQEADSRSRSTFSTTGPVVVHGATWTIRVRSTPAFDATVPALGHRAILLIGTLISMLMSLIAAYLAWARDRSLESERRLACEIVERQRAQEQVQIANHELVHRVKNMLAVVSAIATQTARYSASLDDFSRAFGDRMAALGRVHDLLRTDRAVAADLRVIVSDVLKPYCANRAEALTITGPAVSLIQNDAVLLSLLVNELATNATKYGAWSVPGGRVDVSWSIVPAETAEQNQMLAIRWREMGGPTVVPPQRSGFGSNVIKFVIERSLGGSLKLNYDQSGVDHVLTLPWRTPES